MSAPLYMPPSGFEALVSSYLCQYCIDDLIFVGILVRMKSHGFLNLGITLAPALLFFLFEMWLSYVRHPNILGNQSL